jgi:PAS domain S-box-containing protein
MSLQPPRPATAHDAVPGGSTAQRSFETLIEHIAMGVALVSIDGRITHPNRRLGDLLGYDTDSLTGMTIAEVTHPDDLDVDLYLLNELVEGKRDVYTMDKRYVRSDGDVFWGRLTASVVRAPNGHIEHVIGMLEDVTALRELALDVGERRKELTAIHALSRRLLRTEHVSTVEMLQAVCDVIPPAFQFTESAAARVTIGDLALSTKGFRESAGALRTSWVAEDGSAGSIEVAYTRGAAVGGNRFFPEERALVESVADLLRIAYDRQCAANARRAALDALAKSEEQLQIAVEAAGMGIIEWDLPNQMATLSDTARRLLGLPDGMRVASAEVMRDCVHPDDREAVRSAFAAEREGAPARELQFRLQAPGKDTTWVTTRARVFFNEDGVALRRVGVIFDTTERQLLEQQYRHAQKMEAVGRLAGGVAHDFNNLLTVIGAAAEFAHEATADDTQLRADVQDIIDSVVRARSLTSQLLTFSRRHVARLTRVDICQVLGGLDKMLRRLLGEPVALSFAFADSPLFVLADPNQLEQVFVNLAVNARDAMPTGGTIAISTTLEQVDDAVLAHRPELSRGPFAVVTVRDTGTGMDHATQTRIFEPFFTTKDAGHGTGLGLSLVFGIVTQANGYVYVDSELGVGSCFRIYLPVTPAAPRLTPPDTEAVRPAGHGDETILLVEDEAHVRQITRRMLAERGYRVLEASDHAEALVKAQSHAGTIHLLLTDVVLRERSGRELAETLSPTRPDMRVLYMSGYAADVLLQHRINESETAFIEKPFTHSGLLAAVRSALDGKRSVAN